MIKGERENKIGEMAEDLCKALCTKADLTANKSNIDRFGWDFYVEFKTNISSNPLLLHNSSPKCKIQVKATDQTGGYISVKLSNLLHSVTDLQPAFYFIVEYDGKDEEQRIYIVHIDNSAITNILKSIHKKRLQYGENFKLNKRRMRLHYDENHKLLSINSSALKETLTNYIGNSYSEYVDSKVKHLHSTGFENGNAQIQLLFKDQLKQENLVDNLIGLSNELSVDSIKISKMRFNVVEEKPYFHKNNVVLKTKPMKPHKVQLTFREDRVTPFLSFNAELYIGAVSNNLQTQNLKFRITTELFEILVQEKDNSISVTFSDIFNPIMTIGLIHKQLKLLEMFYSATTKIIIEMHSSELGNLQLSFEPQSTDFEYANELSAVEKSLALLLQFKLYEPISTSLKNLMEMQYHTNQVCQLLTPSQPSRFRLKEIDFQKLDETQKYAFITRTLTKIDDYVLCVFFVLIFEPSSNIKTVDFIETNTFIVEHKVVFTSHSFDETHLVPYYKELGLKYAENHLTQIDTKLAIDFN